MSEWISSTHLPSDCGRSKKRYMVYNKIYGGYAYRCWFRDGVFGSDGAGSIIDCEFYRPARKCDCDGQLSDFEINQIENKAQ